MYSVWNAFILVVLQGFWPFIKFTNLHSITDAEKSGCTAYVWTPTVDASEQLKKSNSNYRLFQVKVFYSFELLCLLGNIRLEFSLISDARVWTPICSKFFACRMQQECYAGFSSWRSGSQFYFLSFFCFFIIFFFLLFRYSHFHGILRWTSWC